MMYLCISFHHLELDGLQTARFLTPCPKLLEAVTVETPIYWPRIQRHGSLAGAGYPRRHPAFGGALDQLHRRLRPCLPGWGRGVEQRPPAATTDMDRHAVLRRGHGGGLTDGTGGPCRPSV